MTRTSKKAERRGISPRRPRVAQKKTGAKKDNLPKGYRPHENAIEGGLSKERFIPKL